MELWCAVYGEGTVFPVNVARIARAYALKEAIVNKVICSTDSFIVHPSRLTLYLAREKKCEGFKWLSDDHSLDIGKHYEKMHSLRRLDNEGYFGENFRPGDYAIHVLVELPSYRAGAASATWLTLGEHDEIGARSMLNKRKRGLRRGKH